MKKQREITCNNIYSLTILSKGDNKSGPTITFDLSRRHLEQPLDIMSHF